MGEMKREKRGKDETRHSPLLSKVPETETTHKMVLDLIIDALVNSGYLGRYCRMQGINSLSFE